MRVLVKTSNSDIFIKRVSDKFVYSSDAILNKISFGGSYICKYKDDSLKFINYDGDYYIIKYVSDLKSLEINENVKKIDLSGGISKIENLDNLKNLKELNLSSNNISKIENLNNLINLEELDLSINNISKIENIENLVSLEKIYLDDNYIKYITKSAYEFIKKNDIKVDINIDSLEII